MRLVLGRGFESSRFEIQGLQTLGLRVEDLSACIESWCASFSVSAMSMAFRDWLKNAGGDTPCDNKVRHPDAKLNARQRNNHGKETIIGPTRVRRRLIQ